MFLCGINAVRALPQSFEVKSFAEVHGLPETHTKPTDCSASECYGTTLKFYEDSSGKTGVFCTLFEETSPAWKNNSTCQITMVKICTIFSRTNSKCGYTFNYIKRYIK